MIIRALFLFILIFCSKSFHAQCECGEDTAGPSIALEPQIVWPNCEDTSFPPNPIAVDDCTLEPSVTLFTDSTSNEYCGISPVFAYSCNHTQPFNVSFDETLSAWGPYVSDQIGFRVFEDGTAKVYGTIRSLVNPQIKMSLELSLSAAMDWATYSALQPGNTYHYGCLSPNQPFDQWQYFQLNSFNSFIIGREALSGTVLQIHTSTAEPWRAFQIGNGASGVINDNSISGAFEYSGDIFLNGQAIAYEIGATAELVGLLSCCASPYINAIYTATDACENSRSYGQIIETRDNIPPFLDASNANDIFWFCDQSPNSVRSWVDACSSTTSRLFVAPEAAWTMGVDQCGNYGISAIDINTLYPVGESCDLFGCTDPNAAEFSPTAVFDDQSCNQAAIRTKIYIDANSNGIFDSGEITYTGPWLKNTAMPQSIQSSGGLDTFIPYNTTQETITIELLDNPLDNINLTTPATQSFFSADPPPAVFFGMMYDTLPNPSFEIALLPEQQLCSSSSWEINVSITNLSPFPVEPGQITLYMPSYLDLLSAENLIEEDSVSVSFTYEALSIGGSGNYKINFLPNSDSLLNYESISFLVQERSMNNMLTFEFPLECASDLSNAMNFVANPIGLYEQNFMTPGPIAYYGIFTNTTSQVIQELDLTFFPDINAAPFDPLTFSANYPFTIDRTFNPLRYNIHFEDLSLLPNLKVLFNYDLDCSVIQSETLVSQKIYYAVDNGSVQETNRIDRTVVVCSDFNLNFSDNLDQCIEEVILNTSSNFYTDFYWVNDQNIYTGEQVNIAIDSIASPLFTLVGENSICQRELNFEIGEIHQPRQLSVPIGNTSFCAGDSLTLVPQSNITALEWYNDGELIAVDDQLTISNTMDITIVAPASGPCPAATQSLSLTRIEPVTAQLQYEGDALLCAGESLIVSASGTNGETILFVNNSALDELTYVVTGSEEIRVQTTNSCFEAGDTLVTTTDVFPELAFILNGDTAFCQGGAINVDVEGVGDLALFVNTNPVNTWPINVLTTSTVEATATNVCGTVSDSFNVVVYPNPSSDFVYDQTTQTITAVDAGTYQWLLFGDPIEGATSQSYTITQTGAYALQTTSEFGCTSSSSNEFINYIGVHETAPTNWLIYPNPTQELLYIRGLEHYIGQELNVVNALGQSVYRQQQIPANSIQIDVRQLAKGVYHLRIGAKSSSFIVE